MNTLPHGIDAAYRATIRIFPSIVEVTAKPVNHQLELARSRNHGLRGNTRKLDLEDEERERKDEENLTRSVRRAKQSIRWLVQRMQGDHMVTLTYRDNMQDIDRLKRDFDHFRRLVKAKYPDWSYVAVREQQQRGAWHMHIAVKGRQDLNYLRVCWYIVLGCLGKSGSEVLGQVNVKAPRRSEWQNDKLWKPAKLASYLTKYMDKGFELLEHHSKRYWASKGTPKPEVKRYWLGSTNMTEFIKDVFELGMLHGLEDFPSIMQSRDRTVLYMSGRRILTCSVGSHNEDLWLED